MKTSRRHFIKAGALFTIASTGFGQQIIGANDRVRVALVGCGRRGPEDLERFLKIPGVELVAVCDPDVSHMETVANQVTSGTLDENIPPQLTPIARYQDYRKLYEQPDIDAVIIASPNYWHALHAIRAMEAGKHVYVEKPVNFTPWEGPQLEAAEKKYNRIISAGYQNRSDKGPQAGIQFVREGNLGKILKVRSVCYRNRKSIGKIDQPLIPPASLDYGLWLGPAQDKPIYRPHLHYDWHWDFNTGNGDMGNQGVHEIDLVCWLLGEPQLPSEIRSFGNRFAWDDAGNTPNMISSWFQMGGAEVILETNDLRLGPERNASPARMGTRVGIVAECENGYLKGGRGGMVAIESDGKTIIQKFPGDGGRPHQSNFIEAIRIGNPSPITARISTSHISGTLAHLSHISYRLGEMASQSETLKSVGANADLGEILEDQEKQLANWGIDDPVYHMGKTLKMDPDTQRILRPEVGPELTGPHYRKGYELKALT